VTQTEERVLNLAIEWRMSRYAVAEALIESDLRGAIDLLIKERREAELRKSEKGQ
jgi:hypothetical protein